MSAIHPSFDSPAAPLSSSNFSTGLRKVRLSDRELLERVQRIPVPNGPLNLQTLSSQHGWNHKRSSDVYMRMLHAHSTISPVLTRQCQVVTGGEMQVRVLELMSLLCAPTERESNALLRALYGSRFIYSSLLHMISSSERGSLSPIATFTTGQQLTVRTVSFVRNGLVNPLKRRPPSAPDSRILMHEHGHSGAKNEQCCYIELLTPTQEGFTLVFCSLDAAEVTAGKAPPERVVALHPLTGWLTAQPTQDDPESLRFTFQAAFTGNLPGGCDFQVAHNRLLFFAKRVCRLEKVVRSQQRQRDTLPGRLWHVLQKPFRAVGVSDDENSGGKHHNWHCIACTRSFLPTLSKRWRRCGLCGYRICASCCSNERVAVYNRYMVALLVCTRCRECIDERDSGIRRGMSGDTRYTGVTLHFRAGR
ncbi:hypothetical protein PC116_g7555 [Phytophthora cactorum]|nr:hypothetical protein PC114_g5557 [Phytophthora cactorum]KAG3189060.1 hypothetical protein C6341_g2442 [Phytophthora cactorum]KAG3199102.1 hypothetical protein PC128_g5561 [Phytophthora cactorum]KAG4061429.1 hypothetical protein PC123_g3690 [Phytophthora cactorum]KAG4244629.1 hypothetical protein PC116_g7555 [Phytophthora cactorum]